MQQEIEYIECSVCGGLMPALRKTKFGYNFCVNCSQVGAKRGIPVTKGVGEDTWVDLEINECIKNVSEPCVDYNLYFEEEDNIE